MITAPAPTSALQVPQAPPHSRPGAETHAGSRVQPGSASAAVTTGPEAYAERIRAALGLPVHRVPGAPPVRV